MFLAFISIMPQMFTAISEHGITARAIERGQVVMHTVNPRDFTTDNYHRIDDRPSSSSELNIRLKFHLKFSQIQSCLIYRCDPHL